MWQNLKIYFIYFFCVILDVCDAHNYLSDFNPLKKVIQQFSDKVLQPPVMDQVAHGCPIAGPVNVTDFEFERDIKEYISPFFHRKK